MGFSIETVLDLLDKPIYLFVILGLTYIRNLFKKIEKIEGITEKINKYEIEINHLKEDMKELKNKHERLDDEHRSCTRQGGRRY